MLNKIPHVKISEIGEILRNSTMGNTLIVSIPEKNNYTVFSIHNKTRLGEHTFPQDKN